GDEKVAKDLIEAFRIWAAADALKLPNSQPNSVYSLKLVLAPLLSSWSIIQNHPALSSTDKRLIENWLNKLVLKADVGTGESDYTRSLASNSGINCVSVTSLSQHDPPASNCQNHRYLRDVINMQWGILTNDQRRF
ncbi:MAG: hypothetical protein JSW04_08775, partial [Desulfobacterales bacterium]